MLPKYHALAAGAVAVPLALAGRSPLQVALFAAAAVLIDADHYAGYVWETGDFSLARAYAFHRSRYVKVRHWRFQPHWPSLAVESGRALHSVPAILAVFLLAFFWRPLLPVAWGFLFHRAQDELYGSFD